MPRLPCTGCLYRPVQGIRIAREGQSLPPGRDALFFKRVRRQETNYHPRSAYLLSNVLISKPDIASPKFSDNSANFAGSL